MSINDLKICAVVPCFNEELLIKRVISTMPKVVDAIVVIDDCSRDRTVEKVKEIILEGDGRVVLLEHEKNQGVGGAIATGYKYARDNGYDVAVVMAGDAQMDPADFGNIVSPVINGDFDYSKGNRLYSGDAWNIIPRVRYVGNALLSLLTKIASGYWHVTDSQSGYTAIGRKALETIDWDSMYKRYGQPNDLLVKLNIYSFRVKDVPIRPVYNVGEKSGVKPIRMIPKLGYLIFSLFLYRMIQKYFIRDFHPLIFFYGMALVLLPSGLISGAYFFVHRIFFGPIVATSALFAAFLTIMGFQFLFFGMWMDMDNNKTLK